MSAGRILVVDDEPQIRRVMRMSLTGEGYEVEDARTGEEALEKLRASRYDLALLDWNLPGMGGLETCRQVRASSDMAIIMLTIRNAERDKVQALDAGADDFITKPFSMPELLARIRAALRRMPLSPEAGPSVCASLRPERGNALRSRDRGATSQPRASYRALVGRDRVLRSPQELEALRGDIGGYR